MKGLPLPHLHLPRELPLHLDRWILPEYRLASLMILLSLAAHAAFVLLLPVAPPSEGRGRRAAPEVTFLPPAVRLASAALPDLMYQVTYDDPSAIAIPRAGRGVPPPRADLPPGGTAGESRLEELRPPVTALTGGSQNAAEIAALLGASRPRPPRDPRAAVPEPPPVRTEWRLPDGLVPVGPPPGLPVAAADRPLKATQLQVLVSAEGRVDAVFVEASCDALKHDAEAVAAARRLRFEAPRRGAGWHPVTVLWAQRGAEAGPGGAAP